jgi:hypothetical protein
VPGQYTFVLITRIHFRFPAWLIQNDITRSCTKLGLPVLAFGSGREGRRSVKLTESFLIYVITTLIARPNIEQLQTVIRRNFKSQLEARKHERAAQIAEGRNGADGDSVARLAELERFCERTLSRHAILDIFVFWFQRQGIQQADAHDAGIARLP